MSQVGVLFIHGIGSQDATYADFARATFSRAILAHGHRIAAETVHWAPVLDRPERVLLSKLEALGGDNGPLRKLTVNALTDALAYQASHAVQDNIFGKITLALERIYGVAGERAHVPLVVFAHSLGGLIFTDYLWRHSTPGIEHLAAFCTFGCNIPLFSLTQPFVPPPLGRLGTGAAWLNFWDEDDCLGFPLRVLPNLQGRVEDIKVNVGGLFTWWNGLSHLGYWDDRGFWKLAAARVTRVLKARAHARAKAESDSSELLELERKLKR